MNTILGVRNREAVGGRPSKGEKSSAPLPTEGGDGAGLGAALGEGVAKVCRLCTHFLSQVQVLRMEVGSSL